MARRPLTPDLLVLLLSIVPYLLRHPAVPVEELAAHFSVPEKQLRTLLSTLSVSGVPGQSGNYAPNDLFDFDWDLLEREDRVSLTQTVTIDQTMRFTGQEISTVLIGLSYLTQVLPPDAAQTASQALDKLTAQYGGSGYAVDFAPSQPEQAVAKALQLAIAEQRLVTFTYVDANSNGSTRRVLPVKLVLTDHGWYLDARQYADGAQRTFRLDRLTNLQVTDERAPALLDQQPRPPAGGAETTIQVTEAGLDIVRWFADSHDLPARYPATVTAGVQGVAALVRHVTSHAGSAQVLTPDATRERIAAWARTALNQYGDAAGANG